MLHSNVQDGSIHHQLRVLVGILVISDINRWAPLLREILTRAKLLTTQPRGLGRVTDAKTTLACLVRQRAGVRLAIKRYTEGDMTCTDRRLL